jgi:hypothetical protein
VSVLKLAGAQRRDYAIYQSYFEGRDSDYKREHQANEDELDAVRVARVLRPVDAWCSDADLCNLAQRRADYMIDWIVELSGPVTLDLINDKLQQLEARPMEYQPGRALEVQLQSMVKRIGCELYWRRQLRRAQVRKREAQAQAAGYVCAWNMPYAHDVTVARYTQRVVANRAMLEQTEIESAEGEVITLWAAVEASTANKSIRRGELMTRIRGCEEWATEAGMVGIFTTNTLPSRFHASLFGGGKNPNFDGSTPRDGQGWLSKTWARARAKIQRRKIKVFGFRVAEPHHDGCPHWHMLLWVDAAQAQQLQELLRDCWLQNEGDEYGAQQYRFKAESIDPARGGAVAYIAKYISKNIDDFGAVGEEGHFDQQGGEQIELIEGGNKARRVTAWASAWGIRQFQPIGQPPVTVWRELRRIEAGMVQGSSKRMQRAHEAVHKVEGKRADWRAYMHEQGGAMVGRDYQLRLEFDTEEKEGRYGLTDVARPAGVFDVARPGELCASKRRKWRPKGTWTPAERHTAKVGIWGELAVMAVLDPTWTRFNNCTGVDDGTARKTQNFNGKGHDRSGGAVGKSPHSYQSHGRGLCGPTFGGFGSDKRGTQEFT